MAEQPGLSEAEREVLKALWEHGPGTVRQLNGVLGGRGRTWAYTTVLTLLQRLQAKGYAARQAAGVAHVFRAAVSRDQLVERRLQDTADELCDGSAAPLLLALVQGNRFTREELARFRRLLDEAGGKPPPPPPAR
jgi:predicted transcriptional regulator